MEDNTTGKRRKNGVFIALPEPQKERLMRACMQAKLDKKKDYASYTKIITRSLDDFFKSEAGLALIKT